MKSLGTKFYFLWLVEECFSHSFSWHFLSYISFNCLISFGVQIYFAYFFLFLEISFLLESKRFLEAQNITVCPGAPKSTHKKGHMRHTVSASVLCSPSSCNITFTRVYPWFYLLRLTFKLKKNNFPFNLKSQSSQLSLQYVVAIDGDKIKNSFYIFVLPGH